MRFVSAAALALISCLVGLNSANAQGAAMKTTPTTKILAIGTINPGFEPSQVFDVLPEEVRETVDLYLDGKKAEAAAAVPADLLAASSLVGPEGYIKDRIAAYAASGVTHLQLTLIGSLEQKQATLDRLRKITG